MSKEKMDSIQNEIDIHNLVMDIIDNINYVNRTGAIIKSTMNQLEHKYHISQQQIADRIATQSSLANGFILDVINGETML